MTTRQIAIKKVVKRLQLSSLEQQVDYIIERGLRGKRGWKWEYKKSKIKVEETENSKTAISQVSFRKVGGHPSVEGKQWEKILQFITNACTVFTPQWEIVGNISESPEPISTPEAPSGSKNSPKEQYSYGRFDIEPGEYFSHIFDREFQIYRICQLLKIAMQTDMNEREHGVLWGPPGCGKTTLMLAMTEMVGPENVWKIDATSATGAGALRHLLERRNIIPPIVYIEEIEKREQKELQWLLSATDDRSIVSKLNFFVNDVREVRFITFCTVNNIGLFRQKCEGALGSRFCDIYCPPPNRETIAKILMDRMKEKLGDRANERWIEPCLEFGWDDLKLTDPREFIRILMTGQDDLCNNKFQVSYLATMDPEKFWSLDLENRIGHKPYFQQLRQNSYYSYIQQAKPS